MTSKRFIPRWATRATHWLWSREPAMTITVINSLLMLLVAFGIGTAVQMGAIAAVLSSVAGWGIRSQVTPVANPHLPSDSIYGRYGSSSVTHGPF